MSEKSDNDKISTELKPSILCLSDEVLIEIFEYLRIEDKFMLSRVCRRFDGILSQRKLCSNIVLSPKQKKSCLQYAGFYLRKRRNLVYRVDLTGCDWIPLPKIRCLTTGLSNLHSLHVMNISLPVLVLSKILKYSKQIRELSWSWRGDNKPHDLTWSDIPPEDRSSLSALVNLHICLPDPWANAVQEFLFILCSGLIHLTVQVDPALGRIPKTRNVEEEYTFRPMKLKSLVAFHVVYGDYIDASTALANDFKLARLIRHLWTNSGGFKCAWENLWTNCAALVHWSDEAGFTSKLPIISSNLKSISLHTNEYACIHQELPVRDLVLASRLIGQKVPPLHLTAPKVERLAIDAEASGTELHSWITSAIHGSDHLVELNVFGIHFCDADGFLEDFWLALKSLTTLRKLAVLPCAIPRHAYSTSSHLNKGAFTVSSSYSTTAVIKDLSEAMGLNFLEEFELGKMNPIREVGVQIRALCESGGWIPYLPVVSLWTTITSLTFDSISSWRNLSQFKLVAKACTNLSSLRFRAIGPNGHCAYVKDVAGALLYCQSLKYLRIDQHHIADFLKDLLMGLSDCRLLEGVCITSLENSQLKSKQDLREILFKLLNNCPVLCFLQVPVPRHNKSSCNKLKNWITSKIVCPSRVPLFMEFCAKLTIFEDNYHAFPPDTPRVEQMQWCSNIALTPPVM